MAETKLTFRVIDSSGNSGGTVIINTNEKNEVKAYLLGQMEEADAERLELRLLTDQAFGEEFDTIVDELTDQYVGNELQGEERKRVEQYFLRSTERQNKARFASELLERAAVERGRPVAVSVVPVQPGILERARVFWASQTFFGRFATSFASIVIVVGIVLLVIPGNRQLGTYAQANLTMSSSDRSVGAQALPVKLEPGSPGIEITLNLPNQVPPAKSYRVELVDRNETSTSLPIDKQTDRTLVVTARADQLERGIYIVHLYTVGPDGNKQRVPGHYLFTVE